MLQLLVDCWNTLYKKEAPRCNSSSAYRVKQALVGKMENPCGTRKSWVNNLRRGLKSERSLCLVRIFFWQYRYLHINFSHHFWIPRISNNLRFKVSILVFLWLLEISRSIYLLGFDNCYCLLVGNDISYWQFCFANGTKMSMVILLHPGPS